MNAPENRHFACSHLGCSRKDLADVQAFAVSHPETGQGLELYLKQQAWQDECSNLMRTYLVRLKRTNECVGYFSLKAGLISVNEVNMAQTVTFDTIPGVELANFAVNNAFVKKYNAHGLGYLLFSRLIVPFVQKHAKTLGICMIYVFALPLLKLIQTYESYGFHRLPLADEALLHQRLKPTYDKSCIFMCQLIGRS